eukprot:CAMPEP_0177605928 /NCGR_PEP_ID=MMETSP0419_2-20121207/16999_1 /TAXON_ID=582737 /ORGANISM="Tetraselmis sp., Strain GSL018" /LENGTH=94 /DNA_ID=CAMNT_0019100183 /DNA_START=640 /DNA_END=924 /DNA_ORIENTATION=-
MAATTSWAAASISARRLVEDSGGLLVAHVGESSAAAGRVDRLSRTSVMAAAASSTALVTDAGSSVDAVNKGLSQRFLGSGTSSLDDKSSNISSS